MERGHQNEYITRKESIRLYAQLTQPALSKAQHQAVMLPAHTQHLRPSSSTRYPAKLAKLAKPLFAEIIILSDKAEHSSFDLSASQLVILRAASRSCQEARASVLSHNSLYQSYRGYRHPRHR